MYIDVELRPCPWCKRTPTIWMPFGEIVPGDVCDVPGVKSRHLPPWLWQIECSYYPCKMRPKTRQVAFRNTTKKNLARLYIKIGELADCWNQGNPYRAFEAKRIDLSPLIEKGFVWPPGAYLPKIES